jgi:hypothetical protein
MKLEERPKKRGPGRPRTGKVLIGFKLSPELAKAIRKTSRQTKEKQSDLVEQILRSHFLPQRKEDQ